MLTCLHVPVFFYHTLEKLPCNTKMSSCNQILAAANKVNMIRKQIKNRKGVSSSIKKGQNVTSIVHQTNNAIQSGSSGESVSEAPRYMNSYRLEPKNRFNTILVRKVLEEIVQKHCFGVKYDPGKCVSKVKAIASEILQRVKTFNFDRYRLVVFVQIGENQCQEFETAVKFLWDSTRDTFVTYKLTSGSMFTTVTCFAVYLD